MQRTVQVFVIPRDRVPGGPPEPRREMIVEAATVDGLAQATRDRLTGDGLRVRSISFTRDGLVAYAEEQA